MCEIFTKQWFQMGCLSPGWLYSVIKPLYALLSSAENWPKKDFCGLYTTLILWNWVNCIELMCYSSRSSEVWIRRAESIAFTPCNVSYLWKWKGAFLKCCSFFVEVRWNDRCYKEARSIDGQWQCWDKLQERQP